MNKYLDLIQKSKDYIDQGFDTFHRQIKTEDRIGGFLVLCTLRAARLSDAIVHLCKAGFTDESLPILRSLIETAVNMRWIMNKDIEERLKQYYTNLDKNKWYGEPWTSVNLRERMKEIGFKGKLESYYDLVVKFCHDYTHGGARTLPHRRLIPKAPKKTLMSAGAIYAITSQMLGHVLKALNDHWPDKFDSYKAIWKAIKDLQPPQQILTLKTSTTNPNTKTPQLTSLTPKPKNLTTKHSLSQNPSNLRCSTIVQYSVPRRAGSKQKRLSPGHFFLPR